MQRIIYWLPIFVFLLRFCLSKFYASYKAFKAGSICWTKIAMWSRCDLQKDVFYKFLYFRLVLSIQFVGWYLDSVSHVTHHASYIIRLKLQFKITIHNKHDHIYPPLFNTICQLMCTMIDMISLLMKWSKHYNIHQTIKSHNNGHKLESRQQGWKWAS